MKYIYIIIWTLIVISIFWFFLVWFKKNDSNFKNRVFFLLWLLSFITISIFSLTLVFLVNSWKVTFQDYLLILTKWYVKEIELKEKPTFYLSWEILSWTTFSWIVYELQWSNFIKQNNTWTWVDLSNYITKSDIKDFYMDSYDKRIEWMQSQINVFLTIITIIWTLLLFLWYKSANLIEEKVSQKIDDYLKDDENWKKIIDDKIKDYIDWDWKELVNNTVIWKTWEIVTKQIQDIDFGQQILQWIIDKDDNLINEIKSKFQDEIQKDINDNFEQRITNLENNQQQ